MFSTSRTKRYISKISFHNLSRLRTTNINRFNKRKWLQLFKIEKKQTIFRRNHIRNRQRRRSSASRKYTCLSWIPVAQPEASRISRIGLYVNANKIEFTCFKQDGVITTLSDKSLWNSLTNSNTSVAISHLKNWKWYQHTHRKGIDWC